MAALRNLKRLALHGRDALFKRNNEMHTLPDETEIDFACEIQWLEEDQPPLRVIVEKERSGQWLMDEVCEQLGGLVEREYFGLRYVDRLQQRQWLDLRRNVYKQLKHIQPRILSFRFMHYPAEPNEDLKQELSRYLLYLQLRRDLHGGRLLGKSSEMYLMAAFVLQAELGDFDNTDAEAYLSNPAAMGDFKLIPNMNSKMEQKVTELHKTLVGTLELEAETNFIEHAHQMETYGVEPFLVKDRKGNPLYLGLTHLGVATFQGSRRAHLFPWVTINKIYHDGKTFIIEVELDERRHVLGFKCETGAAAEALWKWGIDRQNFFTLNRGSEAKIAKSGGGLFKRRSVHRFTGRCQKELMQSTGSLSTIPQPTVIRRSATFSRPDVQSQDDLDQGYIGNGGYATPPLAAGLMPNRTRLSEIQSADIVRRTASLASKRSIDHLDHTIFQNHVAGDVQSQSGVDSLSTAPFSASESASTASSIPLSTNSGSQMPGQARRESLDKLLLPSEQVTEVEFIDHGTSITPAPFESTANPLASICNPPQPPTPMTPAASGVESPTKSVPVSPQQQTWSPVARLVGLALLGVILSLVLHWIDRTFNTRRK